MAIRLLSAETIDGNATFTGDVAFQGTTNTYSGVVGQHPKFTQYAGLWNTKGQANNADRYMILNAAEADGYKTYITGDEVLIRPGQNNTTGQLIIRTTGATFAGIVTTDKILVTKGQNVSHGASQLRISQEDTATSELRFYGANTSTAGTLRFLGSSSDGSVGGERMRIDSSGNFKIFAGDLTLEGGRVIVRESDDGNDAAKLTRDADEGYLQLFSSGTQTIEIRGNGNSYFNGGNVGIGTNSPVVELAINDPTGNSAIRLGGGAANNETYQIQQGIDGVSNGGFAIRNITNGSNPFVIQHSTENVGIGTDSPNQKLEVAGRIRVTTDPTLEVYEASNKRGGFQWDSTNDYVNIFSTGGDMRFDLGGERMRITSAGNVGIGTTSPDGKLEVAGGTTLGLRISNAGDSSAYDQVRFTYGGFNSGSPTVTFMPLTTPGSGNVDTTFHFSNTNGINSNNNRANVNIDGILNVGSARQSGETTLIMRNYDTSLANTNQIQNSIRMSGLYWSGSTSSQLVETRINSVHQESDGNGGSALTFMTQTGGSAVVEQMRIDKIGNVGIGTNNPSQALDVNGYIKATNTGANFMQGVFVAHSSTSDTPSYRGQGYFTYNEGHDVSWFMGTPYTNGDFFCINRQHSTTAFDTAAGYIGNTNTDNFLSITNAGNVGIGTISPASKLSINAGVAAITAGPTVRISKGASPVGSIEYDTLVIEANDVPTIRFGESDGTVSTIMSGDSNLRINSTSPIKFYTAGTTTGPGHSGQSGTFAMIINNSQNVGIANSNPTTKLTVQGVITAGDSSTNGFIRRQHQSFSTMKPGPPSGSSTDMIFVDHTHSLDITVMAYINTSTVAVARGNSVIAYGAGSAGFTQTSFSPNGTISAISLTYVNSGGSEAYILRVTVTYTGSTAPVISMTATGQSTSKLRAAT